MSKWQTQINSRPYPPLPRRQWYDNAQTLRDRHAHHMRERNLYHDGGPGRGGAGCAARRRAIAERLARAARGCEFSKSCFTAPDAGILGIKRPESQSSEGV